MYLSIYLSIYPSIHLSTCVPIYTAICLYPFIHSPDFPYFYIFLFVCLSNHISLLIIYISVCPDIQFHIIQWIFLSRPYLSMSFYSHDATTLPPLPVPLRFPISPLSVPVHVAGPAGISPPPAESRRRSTS